MNISPNDLPIRIEKPWGYEIWYAWTDQYVGKIIHVNAGCRLSLQYHDQKDETSYLLRGRIRVTQGPTEQDIIVTEASEGYVWRNRPGVIHTIEAITDSDVLEVSTPHLDDVVRIEDLYGRKGTSAP